MEDNISLSLPQKRGVDSGVSNDNKKKDITPDMFAMINSQIGGMLDQVEEENGEESDYDYTVEDSSSVEVEIPQTVETTSTLEETSTVEQNQVSDDIGQSDFVSPFDTVGGVTLPSSLDDVVVPVENNVFKGINSSNSPNVVNTPSVNDEQAATLLANPVPTLTDINVPTVKNNELLGVQAGQIPQVDVNIPTQPQTTPPQGVEIKGYEVVNATLSEVQSMAKKGITQPDLQSVTLQGLQEHTDEHMIFSKALEDSPKASEYKEILLRTFNRINVFKNEFNILYSLIHDKPNIKLTEDFIKLYLQVNRAVYLNHKDVSLVNYKVGDNDEYAEFINSTVETFRDIKKLKVDEAQFLTAIEGVKLRYTAESAVTLLEEATKIITEGMTHRGKKYQGFIGMREWVNEGLNRITNVIEQSDKKGMFVVDADYMNQNQEGKLELVTKFGVEALDKQIGGIYEGDMVTFLAPEKGFKTRVSIRACHTSIVTGTNTGIWALENGEKGIMALLRAIHFDYYYNRGETSPTKMKVIDPDWIRKGTVPEELQPLEWVSYQDLITNESYGDIIIFDEDFDVFTFEDHLIKAVKERGMKMLLIDYLQLVPPARGLDKSRTVGLAYQKSLQFLKRYKVGGVFPAQVTQDTIDYIDKKGAENLASLELRDIGAESAESLRTPDVLLFLYGTMEDLMKCKLQLVGLPSRNSAPFPPKKIRVRPQTCDFFEVEDEMW